MKLIKKLSDGSNIYYAQIKKCYVLETPTGNSQFETIEAAIIAHNQSELRIDAAEDTIILRPVRRLLGD